MRKNKMVFILIIAIIIFLGVLTVYMCNIKKQEGKVYTVKVNENKKEITEENDKEKYKDYIITENLKTINYDLIIENKGILGRIYIDDDGYLNIFNSSNNELKKISDYKFITLKEYNNNGEFISFYAITSDNYLYYFKLNNLDINKIKYELISNDFKVTNFTSLKVKTIENTSSDTLFVLSNDNKIYNAKTKMRYVDSLISLRDNYFIYDDNTIANSYGNIIKDENGNDLKIKYYIETYGENYLFKNINYIIITEDNRIIYTKNYTEISIYDKLVKNVEYNKSDDVSGRRITLKFKDNTTKEFVGIFYKGYYGL